MELRRNQQGGFMVEVIVASTLLLVILLYSSYWLNRITIGQARLTRDGVALNQARLQLELETASATADPVGYLNHINAHRTHPPVPVAEMPGATLTVEHRTRQDPLAPDFNTLVDIWVRVTWRLESGQDRTVTLFSSVHRR